MSLFRRKDLSALQAEVAQDHEPQTRARPGQPGDARHRRHHRRRHLRADRQAAANYAGPAIVYSFVLAGLACAFAGLCYAEFAAMIPIAGSAYTYGYATLGELVAWIIGWDLILEYLLRRRHGRGGLVGLLVSFLETSGSTSRRSTPRRPTPTWRRPTPASTSGGCFTEGWNSTGAVLNLPAMFIVGRHHDPADHRHQRIGDVQQRHRGHQGRRRAAVHRLRPGLHQPGELGAVHSAAARATGKYGWDGIVRGAGVIFFAYIGFDAVSTAAQETKNPQRDMPIGILGSLAICTVLYIAVALVLTGIVHYTELNVPDPIAVGINEAGPALAWLRPVVKIGAIAGLSSVILVMLLGQPRIFYTMSQDGLLPPVFSAVHPRFRTP